MACCKKLVLWVPGILRNVFQIIRMGILYAWPDLVRLTALGTVCIYGNFHLVPRCVVFLERFFSLNPILLLCAQVKSYWQRTQECTQCPEKGTQCLPKFTSVPPKCSQAPPKFTSGLTKCTPEVYTQFSQRKSLVLHWVPLVPRSDSQVPQSIP